MSLLEIQDLTVDYPDLRGVNRLNFSLEKGRSIGIIGESGSGKTSVLMAIMGLLEGKAKVSGKLQYQGKDLTQISKREYDRIRWKEVAIVFQNSVKYLNPSLKIYDQIAEVIQKDITKDRKYIRARILQLFHQFNLEEKWMDAYPSALSGGMRQRIFIIMALASSPSVLLVDEPTTSLETINRAHLIAHLAKLKAEGDLGMVVVSHDLKLIRHLTDEALVMYQGEVVEMNTTQHILTQPQHPYTRALIMASHDVNPNKDLWGIKAISDVKNRGCPYYNYCTQRLPRCRDEKPPLLTQYGVSCLRGGIVNLFEAKGIGKNFHQKKEKIKACEDCNLSILHGEIVSIIGESGSGKTTFAKIIAGFIDEYVGEISFNKEEFMQGQRMSTLYGVQMVFQDPYASINPKFTVQEAVLEPLVINRLFTEEERQQILAEGLQQVGLAKKVDIHQTVGNLSGGQIQRISIARALVMLPKLLIADEITASLDVSSKVNLLRLLKSLQNAKGFSMVYITHDLRMAQKISDKIVVMRKGQMVEQGLTQDIFAHPSHAYTKKLIGLM